MERSEYPAKQRHHAYDRERDRKRENERLVISP